MNLPDININPALTGKEIYDAFWRIKNFENKFVRKVIKTLDMHGQLTVDHVEQILGWGRSRTSQVLAKARSCECVKVNSDGQYRKYSLDKEGIRRVEALRATVGFDKLW